VTPHSAVPVRLFNCQASCKLPTHQITHTKSGVEPDVKESGVYIAGHDNTTCSPACVSRRKGPEAKADIAYEDRATQTRLKIIPCVQSVSTQFVSQTFCRFRYKLQWFWNLLGTFLFLFLRPKPILNQLNAVHFFTTYSFNIQFMFVLVHCERLYTLNFLPIKILQEFLISSIRTKYPSYAIILDNNLFVED
jgi:hypothetical protein